MLFAKLYKVHPSDLIIASNVTITFNDKADAVNNLKIVDIHEYAKHIIAELQHQLAQQAFYFKKLLALIDSTSLG